MNPFASTGLVRTSCNLISLEATSRASYTHPANIDAISLNALHMFQGDWEQARALSAQQIAAAQARSAGFQVHSVL